MNEMLLSSGLGWGPYEVGQKGLKLLHLCHSEIIQNQIVFSLQTWRFAKFFEGLNSSVAQSWAELFPHKDTHKVDLGWNHTSLEGVKH